MENKTLRNICSFLAKIFVTLLTPLGGLYYWLSTKDNIFDSLWCAYDDVRNLWKNGW